MQIQYVSSACTCFGSASPRHSRKKRSAVVSPCATGLRRDPVALAVGDPRRLGRDRDELRREPAQVLARLVVADVDQLLHAPLGAEPRRHGLEVGGRVPGQAAALVGLGGRQPRLEALVDEQAPDLLEAVRADELLDVDAAVAERAALAVGLGDLGLEGDDALEPGLEVVHRRPQRLATGIVPARLADVLGARPDDLAARVLLEHVRGLAGDAAHLEERDEEVGRDPEVVIEHARVEVDVRPEALLLVRLALGGLRDLEEVGLAVVRELLREPSQDRRARIHRAVERVAEAVERLLRLEPARGRRRRRRRRSRTRSNIAIAAWLAPPCSGPFSAEIAATIAECMSAFVPATTRAVNVDAFISCSAWRIIAISNARASSAVGASPRSIVRKFSA